MGRQSCPSDEGGSCRLDHGDIFVMDGQCQDEFLHQTDPGRNRIGLTLRSVGQTACFLLSFVEGRGGMLFAKVCEGFISFFYEDIVHGFFVFFWFVLVSCASGDFQSFWALCCQQNMGYIGVPPAGHAPWAVKHPSPPSQPHHVNHEFHNVVGWLTHGDLALIAGVDFLAVGFSCCC